MAPRARGRAQSARVPESEGCTTQVDCRPSVSGQTDARTHIGMASTRPTFVHLETVRGLHARGRAHSARASDSNGVVRPAGCRPWVSGQTDARTHLGLGVDATDSDHLDWVDPLSVSPRSATHRHCRRCLSAVLPKRIGSQSLRLSEFLGSGNQDADWRMAIAIT